MYVLIIVLIIILVVYHMRLPEAKPLNDLIDAAMSGINKLLVGGKSGESMRNEGTAYPIRELTGLGLSPYIKSRPGQYDHDY
jgi:hypothetical protein